jgi:integrase
MPTGRLDERRNRAAFVILAMTGVRISALVSLRRKHLELERRVIYQPSTEVDTKFAKAQTTLLLDFFPEWIGWLSDYVAELKSLGFGEDDPLLPRTGYPKGTNIGFGDRTIQKEFLTSGQVVWATVRGTFERIGLKTYSPHIFRHVHGKLANHPRSNAAVMKMLSLNKGHSEIRTSASYGSMDLETREQVRDQFLDAIMSESDNSSIGLLRNLNNAELLAEVERRFKGSTDDAGR